MFEDRSLDFEKTSLKACLSFLRNRLGHTETRLPGKAIGIYNNMAFRDDVGFIGECIAEIANGDYTGAIEKVCATLTELAEEIEFAGKG